MILYIAGFVNMILSSFSNTSLNLYWEKPQWDTRAITRGIQVNCTDGNQHVSEQYNMSNFKISLNMGLNLSVVVTCCIKVFTTEGMGPRKCDRYTPNMVHENEAGITSSTLTVL